MKRQIRKLLAVLVAVGMSLSLTACMGSLEDQLVSNTVDVVTTLVDDLLQETGKTGIAGTYWTAPLDVHNYYYQVVLTDVTGSSVQGTGLNRLLRFFCDLLPDRMRTGTGSGREYCTVQHCAGGFN